MVARIAKAAGIPRHISPHSLRHAAITNALDAGVPLRDAQILARHAEPRTTEHYDRTRGNLDRHSVHFLTAYVAGSERLRLPASTRPTTTWKQLRYGALVEADLAADAEPNSPTTWARAHDPGDRLVVASHILCEL